MSLEMALAAFIGLFLALILVADMIPKGKRKPSGPFRVLAIYLPAFGAIAALSGLVACVAIAAILHPDSTTSTHCGVYNFFPSLSSAIGNEDPERTIWKVSVSLFNVLLILDSFVMYHNLLKHGASVLNARFLFLAKVFSLIGLYLLTFVNSTQNHGLHLAGFVVWLIFGALYMISFALTIRSLPEPFRLPSFAGKFLWRFYLVYFSCFPLSCFLYWLHNATCWPGVYSLFGMVEFTLVIGYVFGAGFCHFVVFGVQEWTITIG